MVLCGSLAASLFGAGAAAKFPEFNPASPRTYLGAVAADAKRSAGPTADLLYLEARMQNQFGQLREAALLAEEALRLEPRRAEIEAFIGAIRIRQDQLEQAAAHFRRALEIDPKAEGCWRRLGMVLDHSGKRDEAREAYEKAIAAAPNDAEARLLLGNLLLDRGDFAPAAAQLKEACHIDPRSASAHYALAQAQLRLQQQELAQETLRRFQELKRHETEKEGTAAAASEEQTRAIAAAFHVDLANYFTVHGDRHLAGTHLQQAVALAPANPSGRELLANYLLSQADYAGARAQLEELVRLRPEQPDYHANLGTVYFQLKQTHQAERELKKALELAPDHLEALNNLARLYLGSRQNLPEALRCARAAVRVRPSAVQYDLLAWACYATGDLEQARQASRKSVELEPASVQYQRRYQALMSMK